MKIKKSTQVSIALLFFFMIAAWWYIFNVDQANLADIFSQKNLEFTSNFIGNLLGIGSQKVAFLDGEAWKEALLRSLDTLLMSIIAVFLAMLAVMVCLLPTVRRLVVASQEPSRFENVLAAFLRFLFTITRAVPELLWATLLVFIMRPGILTGALALAIHHFGNLGKISLEQLEHVDPRSFTNLRSNGASNSQIFIYGVVPKVIPNFLSQVFYRWEEIIRASVVVGFVGTGGLGQALQMSMSWRQFTSVLLYLICYVGLVMMIDGLSSLAKKYVRQEEA